MAEAFVRVLGLWPELQSFLTDPTVELIHINPNKTVFIRQAGRDRNVQVGDQLYESDRLIRDIQAIAEEAGVNDPNRFIIDLDFEDGSYIAAVLPPASPLGIGITLSRTPMKHMQRSASA